MGKHKNTAAILERDATSAGHRKKEAPVSSEIKDKDDRAL